MNVTEKRRHELLNETRKMYSDKHKVPAVHPRYGNFGLSDSISADTEFKYSSFKTRLLVAVFLMVVYAGLDYSGTYIGNISSSDIVEAVSTNVDALEVWNSW